MLVTCKPAVSASFNLFTVNTIMIYVQRIQIMMQVITNPVCL